MKKKPGVNAGLNGMVIACAVPRCWEARVALPGLTIRVDVG
ncbi:hypothetical protein AWB70_06982 [Caballeronia cordobensis]|uniref:Uncharacterized protein n=1 Tax=Caballeronia cordobensis TaxID=1353886 RepID=A0A158JMU9_CABCO|nr:hypothetical protein [Caballeronia cordobensis]SAL69660.1 hypothetical protein AWB70_06982 [Caballeronia cordobensis]